MANVDAYPRQGAIFRTKPVYQYDYGTEVMIHADNLPAGYKVEFSNSIREDAVQVTPVDGTAVIPARLLESGNPVYVWIVAEDGNSRSTDCAFIVPVILRAKPAGDTPTPGTATFGAAVFGAAVFG